MSLIRFGVSIEKELLARFDRLIKDKKYTNRSEAFRDLIRQELIQKQWQGNLEVAGAITLIYNHHKRELVNKLMDIQHDFGKLICLEIIAVKGSPKQVQRLADSLKSVKGVKHGSLSMSTTGRDII
jgi:CopG family nickel-responsive transcriptional regulator